MVARPFLDYPDSKGGPLETKNNFCPKYRQYGYQKLSQEPNKNILKTEIEFRNSHLRKSQKTTKKILFF